MHTFLVAYLKTEGGRQMAICLHTRQVGTVLMRPQARVYYHRGHYSIIIEGTSLGKYPLVPQAEVNEAGRQRETKRKKKKALFALKTQA